jgi:hypothetical protein
MTIWEFYRRDTPRGERWSWRILHDDVLLTKGGDFDFYADAFEDAMRHGLSAAHSVWRIEEAIEPGGFRHRALRTYRRLVQASHPLRRHY